MTADGSSPRRIAEVESPRLCPSAQPDTAGAVVLGVVDHAASPPEVQYLDEPMPVTPDVLALAAPVRPTEVFRFAAACQQGACSHWSGHDCTLVTRLVQLVPAASLALPPCRIRTDCRWFHQLGREACRRCPAVVTQNQEPSAAMREAAAPVKVVDAPG
jgi:hypothetical protein